MEYLYGSAVWRALVHATKDRRVLAAVTVLSVGAGIAAGKTVMSLTSYRAESTRELVEAKLRTDPAAAAYAEQSKRAIEEMLRQVRERRSPRSEPQ